MDVPAIAESARKHGVGDADMLHAWRNPIKVTYHDDGFTMIIGPDRVANLLEVGTVEATDGIGHHPCHEGPAQEPP